VLLRSSLLELDWLCLLLWRVVLLRVDPVSHRLVPKRQQLQSMEENPLFKIPRRERRDSVAPHMLPTRERRGSLHPRIASIIEEAALDRPDVQDKIELAIVKGTHSSRFFPSAHPDRT
jgi:hypothetical protein